MNKPKSKSPSLNTLLYLFITKSFNFFKVISGYFLSRIFRREIHFGSPIAVSVEPTNTCNLHCPECPSGQHILTREKGFIDEKLFATILNSLENKLFYLILYFQGEPYLHPDFTRLIHQAKSKKIHVLSSTNGHFLTPESALETVQSGLDELIISLDGCDQEAYSSYRKGGSFDMVINGIKELVSKKREAGSYKPRIILQFLVLKTNEHQLEKIHQFGKELGVDKVQLKSAQLYDFENGNPLMPDNSQYSRYIENTNESGETSYRIRNTLPRHCFRMWSSCVITWDGWVVPCCYDKDARYKMGNVREESFEKIWKSEKYREFRERILKSRETIDICRNCGEGVGISRVF